MRVWIDREGIHGGANYALEITEALKSSAAILLMCSETSLTSRNVKQEIALGWKYDRPYVPLLLEPVTIPGDVEYWLEAAQWISLHDQQEASWLAKLQSSLNAFGIEVEWPDRDAPTPNGRSRPLLVGREREQAVLRKQLERMLAGQGGTVLVGGEAGIGKTTLVEDLSVRPKRRVPSSCGATPTICPSRRPTAPGWRSSGSIDPLQTRRCRRSRPLLRMLRSWQGRLAGDALRCRGGVLRDLVATRVR